MSRVQFPAMGSIYHLRLIFGASDGTLTNLLVLFSCFSLRGGNSPRKEPLRPMRFKPMSMGVESSLWKGLLFVVLWLVFIAPAKADIIYSVREDDSAWSIAVHFGVGLEELYAANGWAIDQNPVLQIGQCVAIPTEPVQTGLTDPSATTYIVQSGDNPYLIAQKFHIQSGTLLKYNNLTENDLLSVGQVLNIPPDPAESKGETQAPAPDNSKPQPVKYKVQPGDNAWTIARRFGITAKDFMALNNLNESSVIHDGDEVLIPVSNDSGPLSRSLGGITYSVKEGDTLAGISLSSGVDLAELLAVNGLTADSVLSVGQQLRVPAYRDVPATQIEAEKSDTQDTQNGWHSEVFDFSNIPTPKPATPELSKQTSGSNLSVDGHFEDGRPYHKYTIRRGDTVNGVAHAFGVTQSDLMSRNGLEARSMLRIGRDLRIPLDMPIAPPQKPGKSSKHSQSGFDTGKSHGSVGMGQGTKTGRSVVQEAMKHLGTPYVWSGSSLTGGADCSGFTMSVYSLFDINLPHRARDQAECGVAVEFSNLQPGDLVFFHTTRSGISHVGMYIGGGEFVHSSSHNGGVVVSPIDSGYYNSRFVCARRVL